MNDTEELIKAALAKGAERAPHPGQVINALNSSRRRTRPIALAIIGAVVVVAAIAIPVAVRTPAVSTPVPPASQYTPNPAPPNLLMRFKPTDIPAGFVERSRVADIDGGQQVRTWMNNEDWSFSVALVTPRSPQWPSMTQPGFEPIGIGGVTGWFSGNGKLANVKWQPDKDTLVSVQFYGPADAGEQAKRVALSVVPDGVAFIRPPLSFGTLPDKLNRISVAVYGSSPNAAETWLEASVNGSNSGFIRAAVKPKGTVRLDGWNVVVPAPDGRDIELTYTSDSTLTEQQALDIAKAIRIEQQPDFSWLGK
jgi:hypothetical protein